MMNDKTKDTTEMTVPATVSITEEKLPSSPGYKNVKAVFVYDLSGVTQAGVLADGVLDRYTGIAMEFDEDMEEELSKLYPGDADHFVRITNGDTHYDIYKKSNIETEMPTMTKTFEIICPEDYDGLVFYSGYDSLEIERLYDAMDMEARFYTFDELPYYDNGHDYYFFTYDEEAAARAGASAATSSAMKQEDGGSGQSDSSGQTDGSKTSYTTDDIVELARIYEGAPEASLDSVDSDGTLNIHLYEMYTNMNTALSSMMEAFDAVECPASLQESFEKMKGVFAKMDEFSYRLALGIEWNDTLRQKSAGFAISHLMTDAGNSFDEFSDITFYIGRIIV